MTKINSENFYSKLCGNFFSGGLSWLQKTSSGFVMDEKEPIVKLLKSLKAEMREEVEKRE